MGIHMDKPYGRITADSLEYRIGNGMIATGSKRLDTRVHDRMVVLFDIVNSLIKIVTVLNRNIPDICNPAQIRRADIVVMIERSKHRHIADCPWAQTCAGPIVDSQIKRYADLCDIDIFQPRSVRHIKKGGYVGVRNPVVD